MQERPMIQAPLAALRVFETAARRGNFSRAAEELCVTQSAVSHQIRALEAWLGISLFERHGNRATLLPHGTDLATALKRSFDEIEAACRRTRQAGVPPPLTVAVIPSVAICWLIPRLGDFRALAPGVDVRIVYAIHGQSIDFRGVDLAVVFAASTPVLPGMSVEPFLPGLTVPVCAPHLGHPSKPAEMLDAGLLHDTDTTGWHGWFDAAEAPDPPVLPGPIFEDFNLLRAAALAGQGVALCPLAIVADDIEEGRLGQLSSTAIRETFGYYLVAAAEPDPQRAPGLRAFRDWLLATSHRKIAPSIGMPRSIPVPR
jgi:DNA-binding transcriptional LysR family regulator